MYNNVDSSPCPAGGFGVKDVSAGGARIRGSPNYRDGYLQLQNPHLFTTEGPTRAAAICKLR